MAEFLYDCLDFITWAFFWYFVFSTISSSINWYVAWKQSKEVQLEIFEKLSSSVHYVKQEKHADTYYWFDEETDQFFAQGKTTLELVDHLRERFSDHMFMLNGEALLIGPDFNVIDIKNKTPDEVGKVIADSAVIRVLKRVK